MWTLNHTFFNGHGRDTPEEIKVQRDRESFPNKTVEDYENKEEN